MSPFLMSVGALLVYSVVLVYFSQRIKDFFAGVPSSLRAELVALNSHVIAQVAGAQKAVVANVKAAVVAPTPVLQTAVGPTGASGAAA